MYSSNIAMLQKVAIGLDDLLTKVVFVGGAVAELYADNPELSDIRPTKDVDVVIELGSRLKYYELEEKLRSKGFKNDIRKDAPICRWIYKDTLVDIMPDDESIIGFSNQWYQQGIKHKITKTLPNGIEIFMFNPVYFVASKLAAHKGRGGNDLRQSHDFEDIIYILENYSGLLKDILQSNKKLQQYLKISFDELLQNDNITEGIESALPYGSEKENTQIILTIMQQIADLKIK
jgi:predicted nucleotidyltransferase